MNDCPKTLIEAVLYFADRDVCESYMRRIKWPDGRITCPNCGAHGERIGEVKTRRILQCKDCRKQVYSKQGTIFEDSPLGLDKWFVAVWAIANCKNGISSHELGRALGVTQKTAWFMLHRIRKAMEVADADQFGGTVEADTTYVGGKAENMHAAQRARKITGRGASGKAIVHGVLQRPEGEGEVSQVRATVLPADDAVRILPDIRRKVRAGARVFTDAASVYSELCFTHLHQWVDHSVRYAVGTVHVNGLENFWSLLKRSIRGTYVAVAPFHLHRYTAEQAFRFNERGTDDAGRFLTALQSVVGKRLTYRKLAGIDSAGFMGIE